MLGLSAGFSICCGIAAKNRATFSFDGPLGMRWYLAIWGLIGFGLIDLAESSKRKRRSTKCCEQILVEGDELAGRGAGLYKARFTTRSKSGAAKKYVVFLILMLNETYRSSSDVPFCPNVLSAHHKSRLVCLS